MQSPPGSLQSQHLPSTMPTTIAGRRHLPSLTIMTSTSTTETSNHHRHSRSTEVSDDYADVAEDAKLLDEACPVDPDSSRFPGSKAQSIRPLTYKIIMITFFVIIFALSTSLAYLVSSVSVRQGEHTVATSTAPGKAVVIASYREQNVTWTDGLPSE